MVRCCAIYGCGDAGREAGSAGEQEGRDGLLARDAGVGDDGRLDGLWLRI